MVGRLQHFRSPLLTLSLLISFPPGTKMFQFSGFLSFGDLSLGRFWFHCSSSKLFVVFYVPFLLHLKSSVEYLYILYSFFLALEGNRTPVLILEGSNTTIVLQALISSLKHWRESNPLLRFCRSYHKPLQCRSIYSGGNRTPATMLTASRSTIKLPNIGK